MPGSIGCANVEKVGEPQDINCHLHQFSFCHLVKPETSLNTGLPRAYAKPLYEQKCTTLSEHIFESYPERDAGVCAAVA